MKIIKKTHEIYPLVAPVQPRSVFTALSVGNVAVVSYLEYLSQDMKVDPDIHDILYQVTEKDHVTWKSHIPPDSRAMRVAQ